MTPGRLARLEPLAAPAVLAGAVALRFHEYLLGGSVVGRDAVFFFVPLRAVTSRLLSAGELPLWNDASGAGRALAANPNAAAFWPGTWLVPFLGTTGLFLLHVLLVVLLAYAALRALGVSRAASCAGGLVLLFSGVFQTVPLLFTTVASLAPLPLALAAIGTLDPEDRPGARRKVATIGLALGLSLLGGEPVVAATGAAGVAAVAIGGAVVDARRGGPGRAGRRLGALAAAGLLSAGIAAVQLLPTVGELARSARGTQMRAEEGSLFWSVRPTRLLTLLEPRLTGDPRAEKDADYWGAATFDAGNPYFHDLALGLLPLVLAAAAAGDPRGRAALGLAGLAALLSFGRFFPPVGMLLGALPVFRYPEKWWLLATLGLVGAAAVGVDRLRGDPRAVRRFARASTVMAVVLLPAAALAFAAPDRLAALLRAASLAGDGVGGERVGALLGPLLLAALATGLLFALLPTLVRMGRISPRAAAGLAAALFLLDAGRRVTGAAPAGPAGFWDDAPAEVVAAKEAAGAGRFFVDGADDVARATALARERDGLDPLRPITGAAWGLRYGGDNDVDRMSTPEAVAASATLARMPWGEEKVRRLRTIGVTAARTDAPGPDPPGVRETARYGGARIVVLEGARPEHHFVRRARPAPGTLVVPAPSDPLEEAVVAGLDGERSFGAGEVTLLERSNGRRRLRTRVAPPGGLLVAARSFDPAWTATVDGRKVESLRADGFLTAVPVPSGEHEVVFSCRNGRMRTGLAVTLLSLAAAAAMILGGRRG
ncbi:MAG: hypothetical protein ACYC4P_01995 [Thermoanaerobaculia bacterium]